MVKGVKGIFRVQEMNKWQVAQMSLRIDSETNDLFHWLACWKLLSHLFGGDKDEQSL